MMQCLSLILHFFRFHKIIKNVKNPKFYHLHKDLDFISLIFEQENNNRTQQYHKYKRGSIVMVNFGTNIDCELSGFHFAIVLNKDDNFANGVLTVIPLTSKKKTHYLELQDSIPDLILRAQKEYIDTLKKDEDSLRGYLNQLSDENSSIQEAIKKLNPSFKEKENSEIKKNMEKVCKVLKRYKEKDKTSYAMVRNVTTISKLKILKPINKFDPIGKIYISNKSLDKIDEKIKELFTH